MIKDNNRGQIQLGETIAVVIIVIILLIVGISFWGKISNQDSEKVLTQAQELSVIEIANSVSEFSELKCFDANINKVKCLDYHKVVAMGRLTNDSNVNEYNSDIKQYYNNYFKNTKIVLELIYPETQKITLYDAKLNESTKSLLIPIPVNVKNYVTHETIYGLIIVEGYYIE